MAILLVLGGCYTEVCYSEVLLCFLYSLAQSLSLSPQAMHGEYSPCLSHSGLQYMHDRYNLNNTFPLLPFS